MKQVYKHWELNELYTHLKRQAEDVGIDSRLILKAVFSDDWDPIKDYNGCNFVQDDLHPFLPCFIHDWRWICFDYSKTWDQEFKANLIKFGYSKSKAQLYYIMVRLGYLLYYKWVKKWQ